MNNFTYIQEIVEERGILVDDELLDLTKYISALIQC